MGSQARRWWVLGAMVLAMLAVGLDVTVLSVALPTLAGALHASTAQLQWFVSGYALVLAAALLPGGLLGDRFGRRRMLLTALAVFGAGSIACAYAGSANAFIAARLLAGLGAALAIPLSLSTLTVLFDERERPRAIGVWAAANFLAMPIGPVLGGWLLAHAWWGWVFLINVPVVALGMAAVLLLMPESRAQEPPRIDFPGILGSSAGLAVLTYGFIRAGEDGWGNGPALAAIAAGVLVLGLLGRWELRLAERDPGAALIDVRLFRSRGFTWGTLLAAVGVFAMVGLLFTAPQYFQAVLGVSAMGSGVRLLPLIAGVTVGAVGADRAAARIGARATAAAGFVLLAAAFGAGALTRTGSGYGFVAGWMAVVGLGMGLSLATAASSALARLSAERAGIGSAAMQAVQKVGAPLGSAVLGSILSAGYQNRLSATLNLTGGPVSGGGGPGGAGLPAGARAAAENSVFAGVALARQAGSGRLLADVQDAFVHGMDVMLLACGLIGLVGAVLAVLFLPGRSTASPAASRQPSDRPDREPRHVT